MQVTIVMGWENPNGEREPLAEVEVGGRTFHRHLQEQEVEGFAARMRSEGHEVTISE